MKRGALSLETVAKFILIIVLIAVLLFFVYKYILKGGQGALDPLMNDTTKKACCVNKCVLHLPESSECAAFSLDCETDCKPQDTS